MVSGTVKGIQFLVEDCIIDFVEAILAVFNTLKVFSHLTRNGALSGTDDGTVDSS